MISHTTKRTPTPLTTPSQPASRRRRLVRPRPHLLLMAVVFLSTLHLPAQSTDIAWMSSADAAFIRAEEENRPVLLLITGGLWCDPCRWFDENSLRDPGLAALVRSGWVPLRLSDISGDAVPWAVEKLPTLILVDSDGTELERLSGITPASLLRERLIALASRRPSLETAGSSPGTPGRAPAASGRADDLNGAVFRVGSGMIWNDGGAVWFTQDAGLPPRLEEYDRDEDFLYLRDRPSATVLAVTVAPGSAQRSLWRWDRTSGDWTEIGPLDRTN